ncbi:SET domain-containing protein [Derxia lacustris]|uniref:SET domain-containing protein n=1 Tax=Derxia lacustris TaxID=764842 RepID=UPI000A16EE6B|nr:SET domain-containing protein-lysine N-methyltransferase [Derxia lacustris]
MPAAQRKIVVRQSKIHGRGVFAGRDLDKGERLIEYKGERISWDEAIARHPHDPANPFHTFYFDVDDGVIDGGVGGNSSRYINHSCNPNCTAVTEPGPDGLQHVFIEARRAIPAGSELFFDYGLVIDGRITKQLREDYRCLCGSKNCRGTMLAEKKKKPAAKKRARTSAKKAADSAD